MTADQFDPERVASTEGVARPFNVEETRALVRPLYEGKALRTGEAFAAHADGIAAIVTTMRPDPDLLVAAQLFGVHDVLRDPDEWLRSRFGPAVAQLVSDLRQLMRLSELTRAREDAKGRSQVEDQPEALRRMLLAMANDLRVVLLRLASRLQTLRFYAVSRRPGAEPFARETLDLYAPLANRLGVWQLKWELEDLSFRFLEPETYKSVARMLDERRVERESFIDAALTRLRRMVDEAGLRAEISGRPKHIYSIWNKMRAKGLDFEQVYDVRGLRVIVDEVAQCYQVLSMVHSAWTSIEHEYDDYIARPKPNGYQSLHTVVRDNTGRTLEVQIRTRRMHEHAELGVAAHWRYKEGRRGREDDEQRVAWLRQLLAWRAEVDAPLASGPVRDERIYVLTPQARVVELPVGGTPIDFAFHIHSELGHRCRGARVNGAIVPLNTPLASGQTVEIVAAKTGGPSRDWLNPELGYLRSARSRAKVRQWFNALEFEQSVTAGREIVEKELQRLGKTAVKLEDLARRLGFATVNDLCAAATKEEFSLRSIEQALVPAPTLDEAPPLVGKPRDSAGRTRQGARRRCRLSADSAGTVLPPGTSGRDRRLRDARPRRVHTPRRMLQSSGLDSQAARACGRGRVGTAARRGLPGRSLRRRAGSPGPAARHLRGFRAREAERDRSRDPESARRGAHGLHGRGRQRGRHCARQCATA